MIVEEYISVIFYHFLKINIITWNDIFVCARKLSPLPGRPSYLTWIEKIFYHMKQKNRVETENWKFPSLMFRTFSIVINKFETLIYGSSCLVVDQNIGNVFYDQQNKWKHNVTRISSFPNCFLMKFAKAAMLAETKLSVFQQLPSHLFTSVKP